MHTESEKVQRSFFIGATVHVASSISNLRSKKRVYLLNVMTKQNPTPHHDLKTNDHSIVKHYYLSITTASVDRVGGWSRHGRYHLPYGTLVDLNHETNDTDHTAQRSHTLQLLGHINLGSLLAQAVHDG